MMTALKRILLFSAFIVIVLAALSWWARVQYMAFLDDPLSIPKDGHVLQIEPGTPGVAIIQQLETLGYTTSGWTWKLLMRLEPPQIRAGEFLLTTGLKPQSLLQFLSGHAVIQYRFTIVEGWSYAQMRTELAADVVLEHRLAEESFQQWPQQLVDVDIEHPEGWFLPETYQFTRGDTDLDVLKRAHQAMQDALAEAWRSRDDDLPLDSPYEMLILASIIEKETALDSEREEVAGVFIRRLNKGMRLQTDPTVIYGMGDQFDGDIRRRDLRTDTPYNTYTRHGLPPTPIALPGRASLMAAGQPDDGDTLFFVADGTGGHTFSRTLEEHQKAVNKLIGRE